MWDCERLLAFKYHFGLTDSQIARGIGVKTSRLNYMLNGIAKIEKFDKILDAYALSIKEAKKLEHQKMIDFYDSFK